MGLKDERNGRKYLNLKRKIQRSLKIESKLYDFSITRKLECISSNLKLFLNEAIISFVKG